VGCHAQGLSRFSNLRILDLGSNRIRSLDGLESCPWLQELWLGRNRISQISHLDRYANLPRSTVRCAFACCKILWERLPCTTDMCWSLSSCFLN
jgi:hypothetical protein